MALFNFLQSLNLSINKPQQSKINKTKTVCVAFSQRGIDVWVIWEPYITRNVQKNLGRVLINGQGLQNIGSFYTTSQKFAKEHPEILKVFLEEFIKAEDWPQKNIDKLAELETGDVGIDVPTLKAIHSKAVYGLLPITDEVVNK